MNPTALHQWALRHNIAHQAIAELMRIMGAGEPPPPAPAGAPRTEAAIQGALRLNASKAGARLWRNNLGAGYMADGSFLRWGLANDTAAMNKAIKSSDLIGIRPVTIGPEHVGTVIGQFVAREVKRESWTYTGKGGEPAQLAFIELITKLGGDARFANREDHI